MYKKSSENKPFIRNAYSFFYHYFQVNNRTNALTNSSTHHCSVGIESPAESCNFSTSFLFSLDVQEILNGTPATDKNQFVKRSARFELEYHIPMQSGGGYRQVPSLWHTELEFPNMSMLLWQRNMMDAPKPVPDSMFSIQP